MSACLKCEPADLFVISIDLPSLLSNLITEVNQGQYTELDNAMRSSCGTLTLCFF